MCNIEIKTNTNSKYANHKRNAQEDALERTGGTFCSILYRTKAGRVQTYHGRFLGHTAKHRNQRHGHTYLQFWDFELGYRNMLPSGILRLNAQGLKMKFGS